MAQEDFLSSLDQNLTLKSVNELKNEKFVLDVSCGAIKFLSVVESIQGVLTNENNDIREKGIEFLSWVLSNLPTDLFNSSEINVIVNFYCDCLKGHHGNVPAAVVGLNALVKMKKITKEEILKMLTHLFQHVNCQTQLQADRYNIFSLLSYVTENYFEEIKSMGPDLVFGLISFMEGESNPSCLLLLFNFLPFFIKNLDLGHLTEEMFEILSCYFPIDFNSAAKENVTVTRENLALGLINCLSASSSFSDLCFPMIFEKLNSNLKMAKLDSYKLLEECCKTLSLESLEKNLNELWKCLQKDILPGNDTSICDSGLIALTEVMKLLSKDETKVDILYTFLHDILITVQSVMTKADENMFQSAIKVLLAASAESKPATLRILCHLKPYYQLDLYSTLSEKKAILSSLLSFIKICQKFNVSEISEICDYNVSSCYDNIINLYLDSTTCDDIEVRKLAFWGISELFTSIKLEFKKKLFKIIIENIKTRGDINVSKELIKVWRQIVENHEIEILDDIEKELTNLKEPYSPCFLRALSHVADFPKFTGFVIPLLLKIIISGENSVLGLESLLNACRFVEGSTEFFYLAQNEYHVVENLICWISGKEICSKKAIELTSEIVALIVRNQESRFQQIIIDKFAKLFCNESTTLNYEEKFDLNLCKKEIPLEKAQNVLIVEAILGSLKPDVHIPMISTFREKLTDLALRSSDESVRLSSSRLLASLVNKLSESSDFLSEITKEIFRELDEGSDLSVKSNSAILFTWLVKGTVLSGSSCGESLISSWFDFLGRTDIGEIIAENFQTVLKEDELYLNLDSHCIVKVLYRQRLFRYFPKLLKMYESSIGKVKMNYLLALVRLLQGVPIHLIQTEISKVVALLVRCLDSDRPDILMTSLDILKAFLESKDNLFSDHSQSLIIRFLKLSKFEGQMKIRVEALACLYLYAFYPTVILLPVKHQVIRDLECCLDDKKRLVRKEAVRARCRWFLVGAPGEDILNM